MMADKKEKKAPADKKQRDLAQNGGKKFDPHEADAKKAKHNVYTEEDDDDMFEEVEPGSAEDPLVIDGKRKLDDNRGGGRGQVGQGNQAGSRGTNN
jgi:hypothetical protein